VTYDVSPILPKCPIRFDEFTIRISKNRTRWSNVKENGTAPNKWFHITVNVLWEKLGIILDEPPLSSGPFQEWGELLLVEGYWRHRGITRFMAHARDFCKHGFGLANAPDQFEF
jgi:hypothetical protein